MPFNVARLPVYNGTHVPTEASLMLSSKLSQLKVQLAVLVLNMCACSRQARFLKAGFKTFCAQNTPRCASCLLTITTRPDWQQHVY